MAEHFIDINKYSKIEQIGRGGFGVVFKIQDKKTKDYYAAKVSQFELSNCSKEDALSIAREVNILNQIVYATVVKFVGYSSKWYGGQEQPVIVTEFCKNGSLQDIIELERRSLSHESWDDTKKLINIYGIASGMAYLHSNSIIHRDLKPGNILMDDMLFPKISDFGLSKVYTQNSSSISSTSGVKGTLIYIAPEIFESNEYSTASDVYAFGFIVYEIMTNEQPFKGLGQAQIMKKVLSDHSRPQFDFPIPAAYQQLIERCWSQNPSDRPSFFEITELLKTEDFITETVDTNDFEEYVDYINEFHSEYKTNNKILHVHDFIKEQTKTFRNVTVKKDGIEFDSQTLKSTSSKGTKSKGFSLFGKKPKSGEMIYPKNDFKKLDEQCQALVKAAVEDVDACNRVGQNLIQNKENFPQNTALGIKYLKSAKDRGSIDAAYYLSEIYYKGEFIPSNLNKSKKYIKKYIKGDRMDIVVLYCKILKKEGNYNDCIKYLRKACNNGCGAAMYEYGKLLYRGEGISSNKKEAKKYFEMAQRNGFAKATKFLNDSQTPEQEQPTKSSAKPTSKPKASQPSKQKASQPPTPKSLSLDEKNTLGENYLNGNGVPKNLKEAAQLFKQASESGHIRASYNLGMCYKNEWGVPIDLYETVRLLSFASQGGDTDAMFELSKLYEKGIGVIENKKEAVRLLRLGSNKGNLNCRMQLSICYIKGVGVEKDLEEAYNLLQEGVNKNHGASLNCLGYMYFLGEYVSKDTEKGIQFIKRGHEVGCSIASTNLAYNTILGDGIAKNPKEGFKLFRKTAEIPDRGGIWACRNLATELKDGKNISKDNDEAMHYYRLAASYDDIQTINEIDVEFPTNLMKTENRAKALNDIRSGYERGNLYYTVSLGMCYEYGDGVRKDIRKAYDLYKEAYARGSQRAIYRLGLFYEKGIVVNKNIAEAVRLYKISSDWGYTMATFQLAICYQRGIGVPRDLDESERLWNIAFGRDYSPIFDGEEDILYKMATIADSKK